MLRILPIPIDNIKLYWKDWNLRRYLKHIQRHARHVYRHKVDQQYYQMLSQEDPENKSVQRKLRAANKAMYKSKQKHFKYVHKARRAKN